MGEEGGPTLCRCAGRGPCSTKAAAVRKHATCPGSEHRFEREAPCSVLRASIALDDREEALQLATVRGKGGRRETRGPRCSPAHRLDLMFEVSPGRAGGRRVVPGSVWGRCRLQALEIRAVDNGDEP